MKDGYLEHTSGYPEEGELALINQLSRKELSADEVYVFSVVLCDNEIDRDLERFSIEALQELASLYVGKSGIFDHSMKSRDQVARIFSCEVVSFPGQTTKNGEVYHQLKARAYMPRLKRNEDIIAEIDAGIKKEVSVGCSVSVARCSVCGANQKETDCGHRKGRFYRSGGRKVFCHVVLEQPTDAFEWSFVAVPAQPRAGVVKALGAGGNAPKSEREQREDVRLANRQDMIKALLDTEDRIVLSGTELAAVQKRLRELERDAAAGQAYLRELRSEVVKLCLLAQPAMPADVIAQVCDGMNEQQLKAFRTVYAKEADKILPRPQLTGSTPSALAGGNDTFII